MRPEEFNIPKEKFALVNENKRLKDKELVTKPVGYFKDAFRRFARNKGSLVAACVIGVLVLYAIIVPIFSPYYVAYEDTYFRNCLPKIFNSDKIDFLDGCSNKKSNEQAFLYYYAMGAETGHNALKRQEYTTSGSGEDKMYSYRLDSYQLMGTVFINATKDRYHKIQEYQDANNVQVIYPITEFDKRPVSEAQNNDANYWFETVKVTGNKTNAVNYSFNDDGSVTFQNIYSPFVNDELSTKSNFDYAKHVQVFAKDDKFILGFVNGDGSFDYLTIEIESGSDENYASLVGNINEATPFVMDATYNTLLFNLTGHTDNALDGNYFFGISSDVGSRVQIVSEAELTTKNYVPMQLYADETTPISTPSINTNYYFACSRNKKVESYDTLGNYSIINKSFNASTAISSTTKISFEDVGGELKLLFKAGINNRYLKLDVDGNNIAITPETDSSLATTWVFDDTNNTVKANITGFADSSLDGDYYFYFDKANSKIGFGLLPSINANDSFELLYLCTDKDTVATSLVAGTEYMMIHKNTEGDAILYYADGEFTGDNYHSKMRIEGDTPKYAYGRQTQNGYEIRVNYYEYYIFMHKEVIKDGITEPYFIFGTTSAGKDIFTCLASGARFSFILAISVELVNMIVGAIYGAIEGYYGGRADLIMERIVEILSAVPFMIVITLLRYHMGSAPQVLVLFIAFFLTGWIGMSGIVRMQFYRFKNQEYVLAARTLGAKDWRIMFKHIFPNSLGTIITSCVLVIPGMIFSETSLSYLGIINLETGNLTSVGTLLASGQPYLISFPHMLLFPSIFISLLMLSFNLFGNGLRDAFNPSLRGTED